MLLQGITASAIVFVRAERYRVPEPFWASFAALTMDIESVGQQAELQDGMLLMTV